MAASEFSGDLVAVWELALSDKLHRIEFEHGTTTGKRVIRVDGKEVFREDWMFRLVGEETFKIGAASCVVKIEAVNGFIYEYTLEINGKELKKFRENQRRNLKTWIFTLTNAPYRVCFEKDTCDVWVNGQKVDTAGQFGDDDDDGAATHFEIPGAPDYTAFIKAVSSGKQRQGIIHILMINGQQIPEAPPDC
ncbi:fas apoptotic inhibitory molecule 1-like isoform X1 [Tubulanus polymorphus]|uniref:fas apoptotic inhibitory molecule 1-like isoform X1 n=1 Tax=Tubulanus polymorphus TaxID=672921 RepID=UPI003DA20AF2